MRIADRILQKLGAGLVFKVDKFEDPTTEDEFNLLEYESPVPITWEQYQQAYPEVEQTFGLRCLRANRNRLLSKTDWVMTVDSFQTLENKNEWVVYRQALRDITLFPPPFVWKGNDLDVDKMFPVEPKVIRTS